MLSRICLCAIIVSAIRFAQSAEGVTSDSLLEQTGHSVIKEYAVKVAQQYDKSLSAARELDKAIDVLIASPTSASLENAKKSWTSARAVYSPTEAYRFYEGPIDAADGGVEGFINAWPLDEAYIDYVAGDTSAGLINRTTEFPELTRELLLSMNEKDGEKNISTGFHAIEFLLWGQDGNTAGPGARPVSDYLPEANPTALRRARYLKLCSELLVQHLGEVREKWAAGNATYVDTFMTSPSMESLHCIFTGIIMLAGDELSQERMTVPLETADQENEQSCFSDTTLQDLQLNLQGIRDIYGDTERDGTISGLGSLVRLKDRDADTAVRSDLAKAHTALSSIPSPFDQALKSESGRQSIRTAVESLEQLSGSLIRAGSALGITVNLK